MAKGFFTLEALPARYGDCLLLHYGTEKAPGLVLIDGGPSQVWKPFLKPRLEALAAKRPSSFRIDLLMVSHVDDDHVLGLVDFAKAWEEAKTAKQPWAFPVSQAWFNSFERISNAKDIGAVTASVTASVGVPSLADIDLDRPELAGTPKDEARAGLKVLASINNGKKLRDYLDKLKVKSNVGFPDKLVEPGKGPSVPFKLGESLTLHVVAPLPDQLNALRKTFATDLKPLKALAAYTDSSVPNLSSIAAVARVGGKSILLTGDARGDYLLEGLRAEGQLDAAGKLHVDVLKLPHHGSDRNVERAFFESITADHYVASADGTYGNPDRPTLEMIMEARGKEAAYTIHLTYPLDVIDTRRKEEWEKDRQSEIDKGKKPRRAWNEAAQGLRTLFKARQDAGYRFEFAAPAKTGAPAKIDLLDRLPF